MLNFRLVPFTGPFLLGALSLLALASCGSDQPDRSTVANGSQESAASNVATSTSRGSALVTSQPPVAERIVIAQGRPAFRQADSIDTLLEANDAVVVVRIVGYEDISYSDVYAAPGDLGERSAPGRTPAPEEPPTATRFKAEVVSATVASSRVNIVAGDSIWLIQAGGYRWGKAYEFEGDPLFEVGRSYMVFLTRGPAKDAFGASVFAKFDVTGGGMKLVGPFASLGAAKELSGAANSVAAGQKISQAAQRVTVGRYLIEKDQETARDQGR